MKAHCQLKCNAKRSINSSIKQRPVNTPRGDASGVSSTTSAPCDGFKLFDKPLTTNKKQQPCYWYNTENERSVLV